MIRWQLRSLALLFIVGIICCAGLAQAAADNGDVNAQIKADIFTEGFESFLFPPTGWARLHEGSSYTWSSSTAKKHTGVRSAYMNAGSASYTQDDYLVTPALDFSMHIEPKLEWFEDQDNWIANGEHHYIMVSTTSQTDASAFQIIADMTPANHANPGFTGAAVEVDLSAFAGEPTVYVAFRYTGSAADKWYIDDVRVFELVTAGGDVTPMAVSPMDNHYEDGNTVNPIVTVYNNGSSDADFDVELEILASGTPVSTETIHVSSLASDSSLDVNFAQFTMAGGHLYEFVATTMMDGDQIPANDTRGVYNDTYTQDHIPLGLLFTNAGCAPCVQANQALDVYMPTQGNDVGLVRIHVSWPGSDAMYSANSIQSNALVGEYGVSGVPSFFMDGQEASASGSTFPSAYAAAKQAKAPTGISLAWLIGGPSGTQLQVGVNNVEMMRPGGDYRLRVCITEDSVYYAGSNGETRHSQAMRYFYPDLGGFQVPTTMGSHIFNIDIDPASENWVYDNLRATVYIEDLATGTFLQSATNFLKDMEAYISAAGDDVVKAIGLQGNYPNPFNPSTTIKFNLSSQDHVELSIYALDGSKVATVINEVISAGENSVVWNGRDDQGLSVSSGTYFYQLRTSTMTDTRQMMLVK
jgi:hypothetical protein